MILASASPRRKELLEHAGIDVTVEPTDVDEARRDNEHPYDLVRRLATAKAHACLGNHESLVAGETILGADTIVWTDDRVFGKPSDEQDARDMLHALSGITHHVSTGVCLLIATEHGIVERPFVKTTDVTFRSLTDEQIDAYVATGEPLDKAGAYGIQGGASAFVERLDGDYDTVVGLPTTRVLRELEASPAHISHAPLSITQIPDILVAHDTDEQGATGCTVIICPAGATGGVDVRGGAPATRETDLLRPEETVQVLHAVVLSGGSAFGLAASCGVADELERADVGLDVGVTRVPIVSGACLFDLALGNPHARPDHASGVRAAKAALDQRDVPAWQREPLARGNVGAGTGCTVGKFAGPANVMKSGLGEALETSGNLICGAVVAVNACGDVIDPHTGKPLAGMRTPDGTSIADSAHLLRSLAASMPLERTNTTISCVVTNARLTKAQATKVAQMAADAYAHALRPAHTTNDGDTVFVMATGAIEAQVDVVGTLATRALERAIADGALQAEPAYGLPAAKSLTTE